MNEIEAGLAGLGRTPVPAGFEAAVLDALGVGDRFATLPSPSGDVRVAWSDAGITAVMWVAQGDFEGWYRARTGRRLRPAGAADAPRGVAEALATGRGLRGLRHDLRFSGDFERRVLLKTLEIPAGEVRTYSWVAGEIGSPGAVRAVGTALGHNPIPLLIPCHRVVRADGTIGQYSGGGPAVKRQILRAEGVSPDELEELARLGRRFGGSRTTRIFCVPTCRHSRRVADEHRAWFQSAREAAAAGYTACRVCRPVAEAAA